MKSKIIIFISLIAYILSDVSILSVATGACKDKKYTFVIKANSNADLAAGSATVKLASPESTTPTCTFEAVSTTSSGGGSSSGDSGTGGGSSSGDSGTGGGSSSGDSDTGGGSSSGDSDTGGGSSSGDSDTGGGSSSGDSGTGGGSSSGDSGTGGRRLATGDFDITCVITSKLDNADIKVQSVAITSVTVSAATGVTYPLSINEKATCEGTASSDSSTPDGDKFIQISGFLFLLILTVF
jgi:hypothetical protein